jgi:hypothetical protein
LGLLIWGLASPAYAWAWGAWQLKLQMNLSMGYDDNVRRLTVLIPVERPSTLRWARLDAVLPTRDAIPPAAIQADGLHQLGIHAKLRYAKGKHIWTFHYGAGGKVFFLYRDESSFVQKIETQYYYRIHPRLLIGVSAQGADTRRYNESREYSFAQGQLALLWFAPQDWQLSLRVGYNGLSFRHLERFGEVHLDGISDGTRYSYHGDLYQVTLQKRFHRSFRAYLSYDFARLFYGFRLRTPEDIYTLPVGERVERTDYSHQAGIGLRFLYVVLVDLSYRFEAIDSASYGESFFGHRIHLLVGATLPWRITLLLQAQLLFRSFRNGLTLNTLLQQADNDANLTNLTLRLSRPLIGALHLDVRYSFYTNQFSAGVAQYARQLVMTGLSLRF